jgi:hypothetical protein
VIASSVWLLAMWPLLPALGPALAPVVVPAALLLL